MHKTFFKEPKLDKAQQDREEYRRLKIAKAKIRELDGNACANPFHFDWRRNATDKKGVIKGRFADVLSVHRIEYGSHCGGYVPENGITLCGVCHDIVQKGFTHKILGWLSAHESMLVILRKLKDELTPDRWRWQEVYEALEVKWGQML